MISRRPMLGFGTVRRTALLLGAVAVSWLATSPAFADGPYEGQWREGPMSIRVAVESWGGDCGPRPQSTSAPGGGTFQISQAGDQLTFHLRRQRTTRDCWSENRAVRRVSSTFQSGTWRIVCRTPPDDSRAETGTYTIRAAGEDRLQFSDVSRYDWQLNESSCRGTITTTQTFTRIGGGSPREETPEQPATPARRCEPGAAARVVLRPATAEISPGGEQCFTTRVVDAAGCPLASPRPSLAVTEGVGRLEGLCFIAGDAPGSAQVTASAGPMSARAQVTVRTMDLSDLIARRTESGSVGSGTLVEEDATTESAAAVSAIPQDESPSYLWPSIALGVALLLVLFAVLLLRRREERRSTAPPVPAPYLPIATGSESPPTEPSETVASEASTPPPPIDAADNMICPTCRRGYPATEARCPHDDAELMPYKDFAAGKGVTGQPDEKVCPTCGERFAPTVTFCGKDGTTLEPA